MEKTAKKTGWVIVSNNGAFILEHTYAKLRKNAIASFEWRRGMTWQSLKRRGYKCVKALRTIEIIEQ